MLIQKKYHEIREQIQQGDIIAFEGTSFLSNLIKLFSSITHIAIVLKSKLKSGGILNSIIESTSLEGHSGVCINQLSKRIHGYNGRIWWLPIDRELHKKGDWDNFYNWLKMQRDKEYDSFQAIGSVFDLLWHNEENFDKLFCSETGTEGLEKANIVKNVNASEVTPIELCRWNIYENDYYQLSGKRKEIKRFNSVKI